MSMNQTNPPPHISYPMPAHSPASSSSHSAQISRHPLTCIDTSTAHVSFSSPGPGSSQPALTRSVSDFAVPSSAHIQSIRTRRTRTLDLSCNPHIQPRSSSVRKKVSRASTTPSASASSSRHSDLHSTSSPPDPSSSSDKGSDLTESELTPKASSISLFSTTNTNSMSPKTHVKRGSMVSSVSVADRARVFQNESPATTASPVRPRIKRTRNTDPTTSTQSSSLPSSSSSSSIKSSSSTVLPSSEASASSTQAVLSHDAAHESVAVIKHARRISVSTPIHRRARSDVSILDPFVANVVPEAPESSSNQRRASHNVVSPPTIRTSSFAELEQLTAELEANRPRSNTLATQPRRGRASSVLMQSIAEENAQLRLCSSTETIRGVAAAAINRHGAVQRNAHNSIQVSPCVSDDGSIDWHNFVSGNYGLVRSINEVVLPISSRKRIYDSKLCKADSPTLNDEATWLEEELANCSSDDDDELDLTDSYTDSYATVRHSMDEDEYLTPEGSPLLSPVNIMAPPSVQIMGLGIQDPSLLMPGQMQTHADKSADSLLEQVALHEACIRTLHTLSHDERQQASAMASAANHRQPGLHVPSMPDRRSSLTVPDSCHPSLRNVGSNGDFSATQSDSSRLFGDDTYDASLSPMADMGHGPSSYDYAIDAAGERRASAASYLSTDSTASADISVGSHASSLLYNVHLAPPRMERAGSVDTTASTRRSSIASSYCHDKAPPVKPPRSPLRMAASVLSPLPQESCETPQPDQRASEVEPSKQPRDLMRMKAMPLPPLPQEAVQVDKPRSSEDSSRLLRQASRRKVGTGQPQLPARHDSLDAMVAAAPKETQLKEEFPERLLGDWMSGQTADEMAEQQDGGVCVEPVPLHKRIQHRDGTTFLPGLGEIVPPSPDVTAANLTLLAHSDIPVYPAARKRLGVEPAAAVAPSMLSASSAGSASNKSSTATLKSKLSGRLGLGSTSKDSESSWHDSPARSASRMERKTSESSLPNVLGRRMRKSSVASGGATTAELPAAWKDRIVGKRPSLDLRRPSLGSLTSASTHSSSTSDRSGTLLPTAVASERSRSSLGFRKMLNTITGSSENPAPAPTLEALAATTFESSPRRSRTKQQRYESFMHLSDDEEDSASIGSSSGTVEERRKDLTKILGASQVDLSQPMAGKRGGGWLK